jgi:uncharacterized membrane protein
LKTQGNGESKLEPIISYLLIAGVSISFILLITGAVMFYRGYGRLDIILDDKTLFIHGQNFFTFLRDLFTTPQNSAVATMTAGITVLILTPYLRVIASVVYFVWEKDARYVLITAFVLAVLTISLVLH